MVELNEEVDEEEVGGTHYGAFGGNNVTVELQCVAVDGGEQ